MFRRVTLMLDGETYKILRRLQTKTIKKTKQSCSFSKIIGLVLVKALDQNKDRR